MSVLVGRKAPDFTAAAVLPDGSIQDDFRLSDYTGQYRVLFFWPLDFTFVCPSEIIAHDHRVKTFAERGVQVIGVSIDSQFTHFAWRNTPTAVSYTHTTLPTRDPLQISVVPVSFKSKISHSSRSSSS